MNFLRKIFVVCMLVAPMWVGAQTTVDGVVTDSQTGFPLVGVKVTNQRTNTIKLTKPNGAFQIVAKKGDLLVFSLKGHAEVSLLYDGQKKLAVKMDLATHSLDEVVIIGYGTTTNKDATGSVVSVSAKDFGEGMITSPEQLLVGKVPGLHITTGGGAPGTGSMIRIRGGSSLNAVNTPLFVVDGVPMDNGATVAGSSNPLNYINPSDIASVSILKDASATAIYGSRASNGVIIITTKKGHKGDKLGVTFNSSVAVYDRINQISVLSADQFRKVINNRADQRVADLLTDANTNWQNEIFKTALAQNHYLGINGVIGEAVPFRASVGHTDQDGILKTGNFERTTASLSLSPSLFDNHLKIQLNVRGAYEETRFADQGAIGSAIRMDPTKPVYSDNDNFGGYWEWLNSQGDPNPNATRNPVALLKLKNNHSYVSRSVGNVKFDYKFHFLPELKATLNLGYDYAEGKGSVVVPPYARMNYNTNHPDYGGLDSRYSQVRRNTLLDFYLNYNKELPSIKSKIDVTAGYSYQKFYVNDKSLSQNYIHNDTTLQRSIPTERFLIGFFGRMNYTFHDKYLLTATVRRDGTSRFSEDTRWGWFPSVAVAWELKEENFLKNVDALSNLKLRLGWGITGQENIGNNPYPYLPIYDLSVNDLAYYPIGGVFVPTLRPRIYDPNIKWEEQTTWNVGVDFGFFNHRLWGSVDVYKKVTDDMIQTVSAPLPNLNNQIVTNTGSMENKGIEISLGGDIVRTPDLLWSVTANATYNENEITKISGASGREFYKTGGISGGVGNTVLVNMVGHPSYSFFVYEQVYDKNGTPIEDAFVDQNKDGLINQKDLVVYHSGRPKWILALSSNLRYKNWDMSFALRANLGNYLYNNVASDVGTFTAVRGTVGVLTNIQSDALNSKFTNNHYFSDYYVQDASFLKLDYLTVGYTVKNIFNDVNLRLYGTDRKSVV